MRAATGGLAASEEMMPASMTVITAASISRSTVHHHDANGVRRVALVVFLISLFLVAMTPFFGSEIKGAKRWLVIAGVNVQPSEFLKPAFVILIAWLFAESTRRPEMPANTVALTLLLTVASLLVLQPDFGQTMLIALVWGALFFMAGMRLISVSYTHLTLPTIYSV